MKEVAEQALREHVLKALKEQGLDESHLGSVQKITLSDWQGMIKNDEGEVEVTDLSGTKLVLHPSWAAGPSWPVVQPADPVKITPNKPKPQRTDGWKTAVILPDPQIGYRRLVDDTLESFHDETAIDVALQVLAAARKAHPIDRVVNLGDFLDLPAQGKYAQEAGFAGLTQAAINYGHQFLAKQRAICPEATISIIEGNHDKRLGAYVAANAMAAFGLRKAGDPPTSWPTLSVPYLLRVDDLDVEWVEGYPAGGIWLNDHIQVIHGQKVRSSGSTASAVINDSRHSVIFGHVHRIEMQYKTDKGRDEAYHKFAATPGCLCKTGGAVPSFHSSIDKTGGSILNHENWQQGMMLVHLRDDDDRYSIEMVEIRNGRAMFRGHEYVAQV